MKRLLAYLFLVLGLGLTSNVYAEYIFMKTDKFNIENYNNLQEYLRARNKTGLKVITYHNASGRSTCKDLVSEVIKKNGKNITQICIDNYKVFKIKNSFNLF